MADKYSTIYFNASIDEWIHEFNRTITEQNDMAPLPIESGDYGYASYGCVLESVLSNTTTTDIMSYMNKTLDIGKYISLVHKAWCENHLYFKNAFPSKLGRDPTKTINTNRRNNTATAEVQNLSKVDEKFYKYVIDEVFKLLTRKVLEAGMSQLSIS